MDNLAAGLPGRPAEPLVGEPVPSVDRADVSPAGLGLALRGDPDRVAALDSAEGVVLTSLLPVRPSPDVPLGFDSSMAIETRKSSAEAAASALPDGRVCPFCAYVRDAHASGACPKCTMDDTPGTRRSTGERIGPWFVLQRKNPTAPGLRFGVLLTLARRGHVTPKSIIRGPTTQQLWRYAAEVKGLSRLFGNCWHCHRSVSPDATTCPHCRSAQEIPDDPDAFLESHAMLPVMREVPATMLPEPEDRPSQNWPSQDRPLLSAQPQAELATRGSPADAFDAPDESSRALAGPRHPPQRALVATGREAGAAIMSASELAAVFQLQTTMPPLAPRRRGRVGRVLRYAAAAVLILGAAGAVTAQIRPDWWQVARETTQPQVARLNEAWTTARAAIGWGAAGEDVDLTPATLSDGDAVADAVSMTHEASTASQSSAVAPTPPPTVTPRADVPTSVVGIHRPVAASGAPTGADLNDLKTEIDALAGQASAFLPTTRPMGMSRSPLAQTPSSAASTDVRTKSGSVPSSVDRPPAEAGSPMSREKVLPVVSGPPKELTLEQATAQAAELRNSALDAEARRDWRAAILIWQQIETLPEAARPSDLKVRLQLAKDRLAS